MTHAEQHRMILELRDAVHTMTRDEEEMFGMFVKRDKDDEDLDVVSQKRLEALHAKFIERRGRKVL